VFLPQCPGASARLMFSAAPRALLTAPIPPVCGSHILCATACEANLQHKSVVKWVLVINFLCSLWAFRSRKTCRFNLSTCVMAGSRSTNNIGCFAQVFLRSQRLYLNFCNFSTIRHHHQNLAALQTARQTLKILHVISCANYITQVIYWSVFNTLIILLKL